jgi:hypothetical protein
MFHKNSTVGKTEVFRDVEDVDNSGHYQPPSQTKVFVLSVNKNEIHARRNPCSRGAASLC